MTDPVPYLQLNPHPYPVDVPAIPATVEPGATVLWPYPIAGFEPAAPGTQSAPAPEQPAPKKKAAAPAAPVEGVTGDAAQ